MQKPILNEIEYPATKAYNKTILIQRGARAIKIKATAKELKNADVRFISLVKRGANRIPFRILKTDKGENQMIDLANLSPVLKGEKTRIIPREEKVLKAANTRSFADILVGSISRDIGTPPPAVPVAPSKPVQSIAGTNPESTQAQPSGGKPAITRHAHNVPKVPSKGDPVTLKDLRSAIDTALHERAQREESERFNSTRSAFARIHKSTAPDTPSGTGSAWSLRNASGKLVQSVLGGVSRKADAPLPANSAWRPMSGASLK